MSNTDDQIHLRQLHAVPPPREYLADMWRRRDFVAALPLEQLQAQHQTTLLGNFWHLMNPMLSVVVYYVIFGVILNVSRGHDNYLLFLMAGVFSFGLTTRVFTDGARSIVNNTGLMRAVRFPRALLPISTVLSSLMTFGFEILVLMGAAVVTGAGVSMRWLMLPVILAVHSMFNVGGAFITARLNDSFQDVQHLIPFLMRLATYGSGVMFDIRAYTEGQPGWIQALITWNPLVTLLEMYRWALLDLPVALSDVIRFSLISLAIMVGGFRFFVAHESRYGRG